MEQNKVVALVLIAFVAGALGVYAWMQGEINLLQAQSQMLAEQLQQAQQMQVTPTPVNLDITLANSTFNLTSYIKSDGSSTVANVYTTLTIENKDESRTATILISARDTVHDEDGIPSGLMNSYFNMYYGSTAGKTYIVKDGEYKSGYPIEIPPNTVLTLTVGIELEQAPAGVFQDNSTYQAELYVIQVDSQYVEDLDITVLT